MTANQRHLYAFGFFLAFFLTLFLQFPLQKALPGNCDTWLAIALSNTYFSEIASFVSGTESGRAMYPAKHVFAYGESSIAVGLIFIFFKLIAGTDYLAYYFFISFLFTLSGFGVYLFSSLLLKNWTSSLFAGFVFSCSNMMFAHIDDSIIIFFFISALSLYFFLKFFKNNKSKYLYFTALSASFQIYCSVYMFIYLSIMLSIVACLNHQGIRDHFRKFIAPVLLGLLLISPWCFFYITILKEVAVATPFEPLYTIKMTSLNLIDLVLALPGNIIYGGIIDIPMNWGFVRHHNFHGLLILSLAFYALLKWNKENRKLLAIIAIGGVLLSLGPMLMVGTDEIIPTPLYPLYHHLPILEYLRVTSRAFFIFSFAIAVLAAMSFEKITQNLDPRKFLAVSLLFFLAHFIENTPMPFKAFKYEGLYEPPAIYEQIRAENNNDTLILDLPSYFSLDYPNWTDSAFRNPESHIFKQEGKEKIEIVNQGMFVSSWDDVFEYNREIIYLNWQTSHKLNTINGVNGYFPEPRLIYQYHINKLPDPDSLITLKNMGITHIVFHKKLRLKNELDYLDQLRQSTYLKIYQEDEETVLFKFNRMNKTPDPASNRKEEAIQVAQ